MRYFYSLLILVTLGLSPALAIEPQTTEFPSEDGLVITSDLYLAHEAAGTPVIVLFHQAGSSRGEYRTIAPKLNDLGFNAIAIDQRSGKSYGGVRNQTAKRAKKAGKPRRYKDATPDLRTAIAYARANNPGSPVIIWGSSYSSSLVLKLAAESGLADGVLAFSPGEYFGGSWIRDTADDIAIPTFITSAKNETRKWRKIFNAVGTDKKVGFKPPIQGKHGSSALHTKQGKKADPYWAAVTAFLSEHWGS
jgi:dienelactone hydrolase